MDHPKIDDSPPPAPSSVGWRQRVLEREASATAGAAASVQAEQAEGAGGTRAGTVMRTLVWSAALLLTMFMLFVIARLPWLGDLGIHAATIERLRANLIHPGSPQVDAATDSPYYSPWTVLLGFVAGATGLDVFTVLRIGALISLSLLLTGVWHFTRTLSSRRAAPPLAVLCLLLLWGPPWLAWSGFLELGSLTLTISYPSTFVIALSFHFWALLTKALRAAASWPAFLGLGLLWAVILLSHQYSGVVATFGALALLLGARPWPARETLLRLGAGIVLGVAWIAMWPYYSFFSLFGFEGLEEIHRPLYSNLPTRFGIVLVGVIALVFRWRRDRRDPLVIFFALGTAMVAVGDLTGHWSWGRVLPAAIIPAQLATALAMAEGRKVFLALSSAALLSGAWAQVGTLGYAVPADMLPQAVRQKTWPTWQGLKWMTRWVKPGDTVMSSPTANVMIPAYGAYTVAPGYDDIFLPDQQERYAAVGRFFASGTPREEQLDILGRYKVKWVLRWGFEGGLPPDDAALRLVDIGPDGRELYQVVGREKA
ncbi:hypothetical protein GCM10020367_46290 [Streptomyces sannanensis]|uniref:Glycosyltransferase RgtA/B/C/D-like domain-containing protein n=1 Tax=Streptomyces sannanensis TaxID=285536 RepID=A0ABP6SG43_9ACTN